MRRLLMGLVALALLAGAYYLGYVSGEKANATRVPNLLGLRTENGGQAAVREELAATGLRLGRVGRVICASDENGLVVRQNPAAGIPIPRQSTVNIAIGDDGARLMGIFGWTMDSCLPGE